MTKPTLSEDCKIIECTFDSDKEFDMDHGYFLIRINENQIEAGFCKKDNVIEYLFKGHDVPSVYNTVIKHIKLKNQHLAYLAKELTKAEISLKQNLNYVQDDQLDFNSST